MNLVEYFRDFELNDFAISLSQLCDSRTLLICLVKAFMTNEQRSLKVIIKIPLNVPLVGLYSMSGYYWHICFLPLEFEFGQHEVWFVGLKNIGCEVVYFSL